MAGFSAWLLDYFLKSLHKLALLLPCCCSMACIGPLLQMLLCCHSPISLRSTASLPFCFDVGKDNWINQRMPQVEALFEDNVVDLTLVTRALRQLGKDFQPAAIPGGVALKKPVAMTLFSCKPQELAQVHVACSGSGCA